MAAGVRLSQDHTVTLSALEVLRLITDRLENDEVADTEDVEFVLEFFGGSAASAPMRRFWTCFPSLTDAFVQENAPSLWRSPAGIRTP